MSDEETNGKPKMIYGLMAQILKEVGVIGKGQRNKEQGYAFRGIDDMYNTIHPLFAEHGVFTTPRVLHKTVSEREARSGGILRFVELTVAYDFFASDGSSVTVETVGEAMDAGDKASNKALSAAHKYALIQAFCIPTGEAPEADFQTHELGDAKPQRRSNTAEECCPICDGQMWDNRESKRNPKAPDYKCKNKECDGAIWLKDEPKETPDQAAIRELMAQAEKLLPKTDKGREALARLRGISDVNELGQKVQVLVDANAEAKKKKGKQLDGGTQAGHERERQTWITNVRASFLANGLDEAQYLIENYDGAELTELSIEQLSAIDADINIPF